MEGVLVSAKKAGSTVTTTVVSDQQGRYRFPRARLEPGEYAVRIRAIGYDLRAPRTVSVARQQAPTTADLKLRKAQRSRRAAHERGVARELSRHRRAEGRRCAGARTATRWSW